MATHVRDNGLVQGFRDLPQGLRDLTQGLFPNVSMNTQNFRGQSGGYGRLGDGLQGGDPHAHAQALERVQYMQRMLEKGIYMTDQDMDMGTRGHGDMDPHNQTHSQPHSHVQSHSSRNPSDVQFQPHGIPQTQGGHMENNAIGPESVRASGLNGEDGTQQGLNLSGEAYEDLPLGARWDMGGSASLQRHFFQRLASGAEPEPTGPSTSAANQAGAGMQNSVNGTPNDQKKRRGRPPGSKNKGPRRPKGSGGGGPNGQAGMMGGGMVMQRQEGLVPHGMVMCPDGVIRKRRGRPPGSKNKVRVKSMTENMSTSQVQEILRYVDDNKQSLTPSTLITFVTAVATNQRMG